MLLQSNMCDAEMSTEILPKAPKKPRQGIDDQKIKQKSKHGYEQMKQVTRMMVHQIGWLLIEEIKQVRI